MGSEKPLVFVVNFLAKREIQSLAGCRCEAKLSASYSLEPDAVYCLRKLRQAVALFDV